MSSLRERMEQVRSKVDAHCADPWARMLERELRGMDFVSSRTLLDLIGLDATTGNARRVARAMRSLGFFPIKSRRLAPGGFKDTVTRGWARPLRRARVET